MITVSAGEHVRMAEPPSITIIGRGHSGTRAISHTLYASGVYHGRDAQPLRRSAAAERPCTKPAGCWPATCVGTAAWTGISAPLHTMDIPAEFTDLLERYLVSVLESNGRAQGLENPRDHADLSLDRAAASRHPLHLLDPQPARLHPGQPPHRRSERLRHLLPAHRRSAPAAGHLVEIPVRPGAGHAAPAPLDRGALRGFRAKQEETLARLEAFLGFKLAMIRVNARDGRPLEARRSGQLLRLFRTDHGPLPVRAAAG